MDQRGGKSAPFPYNRQFSFASVKKHERHNGVAATYAILRLGFRLTERRWFSFFIVAAGTGAHRRAVLRCRYL